MAGQLGGRVALVTGGSSGIGRATVVTFAREGAKVIIADVNVEGGKETVKFAKHGGGEAMFVKTDVTQAAEVEAMAKKAVETYGQLDCAFNNAGDAQATAEAFTSASNDLLEVLVASEADLPGMVAALPGVMAALSLVPGASPWSGFSTTSGQRYRSVSDSWRCSRQWG